MNNDLTEEQTNAMIKAMDEAIENGPWDETAFLRIIGKNLRDIRDDFSKQLSRGESEDEKTGSHLAHRVALRTGQQEIFIALYSSDGINLHSWERILFNLPKQMIARPIYAAEEDAKSFIKTKINKNNEAYVAIYINQNDVLQLATDKVHVDKLGKPLLALKDNALSQDNIVRFIHVSGHYHYINGRLVQEPK